MDVFYVLHYVDFGPETCRFPLVLSSIRDPLLLKKVLNNEHLWRMPNFIVDTWWRLISLVFS